MEKLMMEKDDTSSRKPHLARFFLVTHGPSCDMHLWSECLSPKSGVDPPQDPTA